MAKIVASSDRNHFLGLEPDQMEWKSSKVVVLSAPLEKTTSYRKGTHRAPQAIVDASTQVEFFDPELALEPCKLGIHTDWSLDRPGWNEAEMKDLLNQIRERTRHHLEAGKFLLTLGGEHTITVGLIDPFLEKWGKDLTVVHIDAHADLKDQYQGNPYSHASVMRRLLGRVPIVSVGIRSVDSEEFEVAASHKGIDVFYAHEMHRNPNWASEVLSKVKTKHVYLTVDVDGLDPSVIPAVGTPEPGGLSWFDTLDFIRRVGRDYQIVGADVNELCPNPAEHHADFATAKLCYKIIGYALFNQTGRRT